MSEIKQDIKTAMAALYPEAIKSAETPTLWKPQGISDRHRQLVEIETRIAALRPDAQESADIVVAIAESLKLRFDDCTEACLYLSMAKLSLERLDVGYQVEAKEELEALQSLSHKAERRMP